MKLHKLISRTVLATALLGATIGGISYSASASADDESSNTQLNQPIPDNGYSSKDMSGQFYIQNGLLTLDNVPQLNFSNDNSNSSNTLTLSKDNNNGNSNTSGLLEVTDYRNSSNQNNNSNSWSLTASMGNVNQNVNGNNQNVNNQWEVFLNNTNNNTAKNLDNGNMVPNLSNTTLTNGSNDQPVMSMSKGSTNGYGVNQIKYANENDAKLTAPNVRPGNYNTSITWKLDSTVNSGSNAPH